jgi:hypothetical protein
VRGRLSTPWMPLAWFLNLPVGVPCGGSLRARENQALEFCHTLCQTRQNSGRAPQVVECHHVMEREFCHYISNARRVTVCILSSHRGRVSSGLTPNPRWHPLAAHASMGFPIFPRPFPPSPLPSLVHTTNARRARRGGPLKSRRLPATGPSRYRRSRAALRVPMCHCPLSRAGGERQGANWTATTQARLV